MILAIDTETTGTDFYHGCRPFLVTMCDGSSNYHWMGEVNPYTREVFWDEEDIADIQKKINKAKICVFHNSTFDIKALDTIGVKVPIDKVDDTLLMGHAIHSAKRESNKGKKKTDAGRTLGLKDLAIEYFQYWDDDEKELEEAVKAARIDGARLGYDIAKKGHKHFPGLRGAVKWWKMDYWLALKECLKYAYGDVERTFLLYGAFKVEITAGGLWEAYKTRRKLIPIVYDITETGLQLNKAEATKLLEDNKRKQERLRWKIKEGAGIKYKFNPRKPAHLIDLFHSRLKIPVMFTTPKGRPSVNKDAVKYYINNYGKTYKEIEYYQKWAEIETENRYVLSYLNWTDDEDKIHSRLNITGTRLCRQSATEPNQQNIKGVLEELFEPPPGYIILDKDFVNIEMRLWATSVGNEELIEIFRQGRNFHEISMQEVYPREYEGYMYSPEGPLKKYYKFCKNGNFSIIYGATERKADDTYKVKGAYAKLNKRFPGIKEYTDSLIRKVYENIETYEQPCIYTMGGYRLDVPLDEPFKACNYYIQGSAGFITGKAMVAISMDSEYLEHNCKMVSQVHDSIKTLIPIHPRIQRTIDSIVYTMETASMDIFGHTPVSYKVKYNKLDIDNPYIQDFVIPF